MRKRTQIECEHKTTQTEFDHRHLARNDVHLQWKHARKPRNAKRFAFFPLGN